MGKRFDFTVFLNDERTEIVKSLTEDEAAVFNRRAHGDSVVATAYALSESEATVKRRSASVMRKINRMRGMQRRNVKTTEDELYS